jgi:sialate O-acetylesterase
LNSAFLREAQLKASTILPNTGMASLMDAGEKIVSTLPKRKLPVSVLHIWPLQKPICRNKGFEYSGPVFKGYDC